MSCMCHLIYTSVHFFNFILFPFLSFSFGFSFICEKLLSSCLLLSIFKFTVTKYYFIDNGNDHHDGNHDDDDDDDVDDDDEDEIITTIIVK